MNSPQKVDETLVDRFERIDDEVPVTDDEAKAILAEAGIDPQASLKRLFAKLDEAVAKERSERFDERCQGARHD